MLHQNTVNMLVCIQDRMKDDEYTQSLLKIIIISTKLNFGYLTEITYKIIIKSETITVI